MKIKRKSLLRQKLKLFSTRIALVVVAGIVATPMAFGAGQRSFDATLEDSQRGVNLSTTDMVAKDGFMYETDWESGSLMITDVRDAYDPKVTFGKGDFLNSPFYIARVGSTVYVESSDENGDGRVTSFDISDPQNVEQRDAFDIVDASITGCDSIRNLYSLSDALLVDLNCSSGNRALLLNVSDPANIVAGDVFDYSPYVTSGSILEVQSSGTSAFVYFGDDTLYAEIDVSDVSNISAIETSPFVTLPNFDNAERQKVGDHVYATTYSYVGGLREYDVHAIDVSNPASPSIVSTTDMCAVKYTSNKLQYVGGNRLIAACNGELFDIDVSNPLAPAIGPKAVTLETFTAMYVDTDGKVYQNADFENVITEQVYDASSPGAAPSFLGANVNDLGGHGYSMYMMVPPGSQIAYVMQHTWPIIRTVDISDPNNMEVLDTQFLTQNGQLVKEFGFSNRSNVSFSSNGDYMLIADTSTTDPVSWAGTLDVIDISDPNNITVADRQVMPVSDDYLTSKVVGDTWYVLNDDSLKTFAVNPSNGTLTALDTQAYTPPAGFSATNSRLAIVNDTALMTFSQQSARTIDVSDPSSLGMPASTNLPVLPAYALGQPYVVGNHILVSAGGSPGRVHSIDVSNPAALTLSSSISSTGFKSGTFQDYSPGVVLLSNAQGDAFSKINITDLGNLQLTEQTGLGGLYPDVLDGFDEVWDGLAVSGNYAFGASSIADGNMYSFDISDLSVPKPLDIITRQTPLYQPQSLHAANGKLYVGSRTYTEVNADLVSYDLTDPNKPEYDGAAVHDFTDVLDMVTNGNRLYAVRNWGGLGVYDTTNPRFPVLKNLVGDASSPTAVAIQDTTLYIADSNDGLMIYDISDPDNPTLESTFEDANFTGLHSIKVVGSTLYGVMEGDNDVIVIDVSDSSNPSTVTTVTDTNFNSLSKLFVQGSRLYVSSKGDGASVRDSITVFDISNSMAPSKTGQYVAEAGTLGYGNIEYYQGFVLVAATDAHRIDVIDFDDEDNPIFERSIGNDSSLQGANNMKVVGDNLYVISQFGNSLNTYALAMTTGSVGPVVPPVTPVPPSEPAVPTMPSAPLAPNTGGSASSWWPLYLIPVFVLALAVLITRRKLA